MQLRCTIVPNFIQHNQRIDKIDLVEYLILVESFLKKITGTCVVHTHDIGSSCNIRNTYIHNT